MPWITAELAGIFVALVAIGTLLHQADRRRVIRAIERRGGRPFHVSERRPALIDRVLSERSTTFWTVEYLDRDGRKRQADVTATFLRCIVTPREGES
jgi:hypothetical protein